MLRSLGFNSGRARACTICGAAIRLPGLVAAGTGPVCESAHCRVLIDLRARMSPEAFRHLVHRRAREQRDREQRALVTARRLQAKRDAEAREDQSVWESVTRRLNAYPPSRYARLVLPSGPRHVSNLPQRRRNRYRDHLNRIIAEAVVRPLDRDAHRARELQSERPPGPTTAPPLVDKFCTLCGGGCCTRGGDAAYLTAATIRRFMNRHPELRPRDVLAAYLDRLVHRTETHSCVNHGANGCSLPREMRSDTCNDFYCGTLSAWIAKAEAEPGPERALVIVRRQDVWSRDDLGETNDIVDVAVVSDQGVVPAAR